MALDRPATVRLFAAGDRDNPGPSTDYRVWLTRLDSASERILDIEGTREETRGRFRMRWFQALADYQVERDGVLLFDGSTWLIQSVDEVDDGGTRTDTVRALRTRRRWLELVCIERPTE